MCIVGDRRMPVPGILGLIAAAAASVFGALADRSLTGRACLIVVQAFPIG